jgi:hypothetical protein
MSMPGTGQTLESSSGHAMAGFVEPIETRRMSEQNNRRAPSLCLAGWRQPCQGPRRTCRWRSILEMSQGPLARFAARACKGKAGQTFQSAGQVGWIKVSAAVDMASLIGLLACAGYRRRSRQHGCCVVCWPSTWQRVFLVPEGCLLLTVGLALSRILPPHFRRVAFRWFLSPGDQPSFLFLGPIFGNVDVFFNRDQMGFGSSDRTGTPLHRSRPGSRPADRSAAIFWHAEPSRQPTGDAKMD